jgi:hypothetical protein
VVNLIKAQYINVQNTKGKPRDEIVLIEGMRENDVGDESN